MTQRPRKTLRVTKPTNCDQVYLESYYAYLLIISTIRPVLCLVHVLYNTYITLFIMTHLK